MKLREPRHAVKVPARMRHGAGWFDATILNLSNRGLMFRCTHRLDRGHLLELRRGSHIIIARVAWSEDGRCGAQAQGILPVADIVLDNPAHRGRRGLAERRSLPRSAATAVERSRQLGRAVEFVLAGVGAACVAFMLADTAIETLQRPLRKVDIALSGGAQPISSRDR